MTRILLIEDDRKMTELLSSDLELEGYSVSTAADGADGYEKAKKLKPDLILLDIMLPKMTGYDVCRALRKDGSDVPIILLTAKGQEMEKVVGLEIGADDYVTKPFSGMELLARVKALLRRHQRDEKKVETIKFDDVEIDFGRLQATRAGKSLGLTQKEFQLLELLIRHDGRVVSRKQFLEEIWGYDEMPSTRTVDTQILTLRQKLNDKSSTDRDYIETVHGVGYRFNR